MNKRIEGMKKEIDVLDHGFVRLVDWMGDDLSVARAARVSYDAEWRAGSDKGSDERLIKYLADNRHSTPFEAVEFQFEVKAPIFVVRQWHRHRTWSYNELSGRYRELPEEFYVPEIDVIGMQSHENKQARVLTDALGDDNHAKMGLYQYRNICAAAFDHYRQRLEDGWPRELARMCLPLSTYTHMFAKVDLLNLIKFLQLRDDDHAQYEIRVYAQAMRTLVNQVVPVSMEAWGLGVQK